MFARNPFLICIYDQIRSVKGTTRKRIEFYYRFWKEDLWLKQTIPRSFICASIIYGADSEDMSAFTMSKLKQPIENHDRR